MLNTYKYTKIRILSQLFFWGVIFAIIGVITKEFVLSISIGAIALLIWHCKQLLRLNYWLWNEIKLTPPQGRSSWESAFNGLFRLQKKNRKRISKLQNIINSFRLGTEAMPDATVALDENYNIVWCNKLSEFVLGLKWPQDKGRMISNLIRTPDFVAYLNSKSFKDPLELTFLNERVLEVRIVPYAGEQSLLVARDITRIKQLEIIRKEFVANVSHELKTPLTVLNGYLETMKDMPEYSSLKKPLISMEQQTMRMQSIIEQLLQLSKIEAQAQELSIVNMDNVFTKIIPQIKALTINHELIMDIEPNIEIYGDELQLISAIMNLISNAAHYTENGGRITVTLIMLANENMLFKVEDTGIGINPIHIGRITERFYRVDSARDRATGGTGLGLAIVKHVLSAHHSMLDIKSKEGYGSCFSFEINSKLVKELAKI